MAGACTFTCPEGYTDCSGACADLQRDPENCGSCAFRCGAGDNCYDGECLVACPGGFHDCSGTCRDWDSDRMNCGACENECLDGERCSGGTCVVSCEAPLISCPHDADGDTLTAVLAGGTTDGLLTLNGDGSFTYTPDPDWHGTDGFTYLADDGQLEGGPAARLFASGKAAAAAVLQALAPDDHVVAPHVMYWGLRNFLVDFAGTWGLGLDFFDPGDPDALARTVLPDQVRVLGHE